MKTPHIHAELIKAWADGAQIQYKDNENWYDVNNRFGPYWTPTTKYRVKPEPKPDVVMYCYVDKKEYSDGSPFASVSWVSDANPMLLKTDNIMFVFDGETDELKDCQILAKE